jgi:hypothetical protein
MTFNAYAECRYAECHYAGCCYAECRGPGFELSNRDISDELFARSLHHFQNSFLFISEIG